MKEKDFTFSIVQDAAKTSLTYFEFSVKLGRKNQYNVIKRLINKFNIDCSHFTQKSEKLLKTCPVCKIQFLVSMKGSQSRQITCSHACSNRYFRLGKQNGNYKIEGGITPETMYRRKCFKVFKKQCIICSEDKIVAVHHYDGNHDNNDINNLVPLCPTHHQYMHSRFKELIEDRVKEFLTNAL